MHHPYPWQNKQWEQLAKAKHKQTLPHAILLAGPQNIGKYDFALAIAESILCEKSGELACGKCQSCHWLQAGTHPDLIVVTAEDEKKAIKIDTIRQLIKDLQLTSHQRYQIVVINPAEKMNIAAANALLKTLEEPSGRVVFFLVSAQPTLLPATVLSRCQQIKFPIPSKKDSKQWLQNQLPAVNDIDVLLALAGNLPLLALKLFRSETLNSQMELIEALIKVYEKIADPLNTAEKIQTQDFELILSTTQSLILDLIKIKLNIQNLHHMQWHEQLKKISAQYNFVKLFQLYDQINELKAIHNKNIALNKQLQIEGLLINIQN